MLLRLEILCFIMSFSYIGYYIIDFLLVLYKEKRKILSEKIERQESREKIREEQKQITLVHELTGESKEAKKTEKIESKTYITPEQGEQIREIAKRAQIHISRGYFESARSLIIEGLALKKHDKDLNLLLADVYEREKKYQNAAYIYKDMLEIYIEDEYMLQRLGNIYALLGKVQKSLDMYERAHKKDKSNTEILDIMAHLNLELKDYKKALKYANMYLKEKPRNAEKLGIKGYALEKLDKSIEAIKAYEQVLQIQPYNSEIQDRIIVLNNKKNSLDDKK